MALYSPFVERNIDKIAGAQQQAAQSKLAQSAYMGDSEALGQLYGTNPQLADQIKQRKLQEQQNQIAMQGKQQEANLKKQKIARQIAEDVADMDYEQALQYSQQQAQAYGVEFPPMSREQHEQFKKAFGKGGGGAFGGTGMDAQVSNMLEKGAKDPAFRDTPEYARAWQLANEPKVVRTPTGDILLRPELPPVFKPPGSKETTVQDVKSATKKDVEVIPGTEKEVVTTADEKLSSGYLKRMQAAEEVINSLGDFNPADYLEQLKGTTNITASPELQQYRQAADDWIRSKLRRESGAVIAEEEMKKEYEVYFPQIGDKPEVLKQKERARKQAEEAMRTAAGREGRRGESAQAGAAPVQIKSDDDYNALPSGTEFIDPNGQRRRKP